MLLDPPGLRRNLHPGGCFIMFLFLFFSLGLPFQWGFSLWVCPMVSLHLSSGFNCCFSLSWCFEPGQIPATGENYQKGEEGWSRRVGHQPTIFSFHDGQQGLCSQKKTSERVLSIFEGNLSDAFSHVFSQNVEGVHKHKSWFASISRITRQI